MDRLIAASPASPLFAAHALLLILAFLLEPGALTGHSATDLIDLASLAVGQSGLQLLLQENLPLGDFALVERVHLGEGALLFGR